MNTIMVLQGCDCHSSHKQNYFDCALSQQNFAGACKNVLLPMGM